MNKYIPAFIQELKEEYVELSTLDFPPQLCVVIGLIDDQSRIICG